MVVSKSVDGGKRQSCLAEVGQLVALVRSANIGSRVIVVADSVDDGQR